MGARHRPDADDGVTITRRVLDREVRVREGRPEPLHHGDVACPSRWCSGKRRMVDVLIRGELVENSQVAAVEPGVPETTRLVQAIARHAGLLSLAREPSLRTGRC